MSIGGTLNLAALAKLHRPRDRDTLRAAAIEMQQRGNDGKHFPDCEELKARARMGKSSLPGGSRGAP